jgi:coatomer protein complex subunit epsilon
MLLSLTFSLGGSKIQAAHLIFQDFLKKCTMTCMILNGKAQWLMQMGNFEQAEGLLLESLNKVSSSHFR